MSVQVATLLVAALSLAACSTQSTVSGWFGQARSEEAGEVYYAGEAGLNVRTEPSSSSPVVGRLSLHEKVTRYKIERGYAYVKSGTRDLTGWVNNAMLIWRLPARTEPAPDTPAEPAAEEQRDAPAMPVTPVSEEPPAADASPTPSVVPPSLFDAY